MHMKAKKYYFTRWKWDRSSYVFTLSFQGILTKESAGLELKNAARFKKNGRLEWHKTFQNCFSNKENTFKTVRQSQVLHLKNLCLYDISLVIVLGGSWVIWACEQQILKTILLRKKVQRYPSRVSKAIHKNKPTKQKIENFHQTKQAKQNVSGTKKKKFLILVKCLTSCLISVSSMLYHCFEQRKAQYDIIFGDADEKG